MRKFLIHFSLIVCVFGEGFVQSGWCQEHRTSTSVDVRPSPPAVENEKTWVPKVVITPEGIHTLATTDTITRIVRLRNQNAAAWPIVPYSQPPFVTKWDMNAKGGAFLVTSSFGRIGGLQTQFKIHYYSSQEMKAVKHVWESTGSIGFNPAVYTIVQAEPLNIVLFRSLRLNRGISYGFDVAMEPDGSVLLFVAAEARLSVWQHPLKSGAPASGPRIPDSEWTRIVNISWTEDVDINVAMSGSSVDVIGKDGSIYSFSLEIPTVSADESFWPEGKVPDNTYDALVKAPLDVFYGPVRSDITIQRRKPIEPVRAIVKDTSNDTVYWATDTNLKPVKPEKPAVARSGLDPHGRLAEALSMASRLKREESP